MLPGRSRINAGYSQDTLSDGSSGDSLANAVAHAAWSPTKCQEGPGVPRRTNPVTAPASSTRTPP